MIENDKIALVLDCLNASLDEFSKQKEMNKDVGFACVKSLATNVFVKKLLGNKDSPYGRYLYEYFRKRDLRKSAVLQHIVNVFNCESGTALEILQLIPEEALKTLIGEIDKIDEINETVDKRNESLLIVNP